MNRHPLGLARLGDNMGSPGSAEERIEDIDPVLFVRYLQRALSRCSESEIDSLRRTLGCGCGGTGGQVDVAGMLRAWACCDPNRRLSRLEEEELRSNDGDWVDIPNVNGAGASITVDVPAYGVAWYFRKFSVDGRVPDTGSLSKVRIMITLGNRQIAKFPVSQYYKENCCDTIVEEYQRYKRCMGYDSKFRLVVTNDNANAADVFTGGVFSWARGYPAGIDDLEIFTASKSCGT